MSENENIEQKEEKKNENDVNVIKIQSITLKDCLNADCHFGTTNRKRNKKMSPFIGAFVNGTNIINLNQTIIKMQEAYQAAYDITKNGGKILFINKNEKIENEIVDDADRSGSFYIIQRWLGGTFTNFKVIRSCSRKLKKLEKDSEDEAVLQNLNKKEQSLMHKKIFKMSKNLEGIKDMIKLPQAIFVTNPNDNKIAVKEAKTMNIKIFAIANTDCNPDNIDFVIPANNNSVASIKLISNLISDAIVSAKCGLKDITFEENNDKNVRFMIIRDAKEKIAKKIAAIRAAKKEKYENMLKKIKMRKANEQKNEIKKEDLSEKKADKDNEKIKNI